MLSIQCMWWGAFTGFSTSDFEQALKYITGRYDSMNTSRGFLRSCPPPVDGWMHGRTDGGNGETEEQTALSPVPEQSPSPLPP